MAFTRKLIDVDFSLAAGVFAGGGNTATATGLRVSCKIINSGAPSMGQLEAAIYGLTLSMMNQLTTLGNNIDSYGKNKITVRAGDTAGSLPVVFTGTITAAYVDAAAMPQVCLRVNAYASNFESVKPVAPTSVDGAGDVPQMMKGIADLMGFTFENNGVQAKLTNPYLAGTARQQAEQLAEHAGIEIDISNENVAIWPAGQARNGDATLISPSTGMVGYPAFTQSGIIVATLFVPTLKRGGQITVQSDLAPACGTWWINNLTYDLESMVPGGKWFAVIEAGRIKVQDTP